MPRDPSGESGAKQVPLPTRRSYYYTTFTSFLQAQHLTLPVLVTDCSTTIAAIDDESDLKYHRIMTVGKQIVIDPTQDRLRSRVLALFEPRTTSSKFLATDRSTTTAAIDDESDLTYQKIVTVGEKVVIDRMQDRLLSRVFAVFEPSISPSQFLAADGTTATATATATQAIDDYESDLTYQKIMNVGKQVITDRSRDRLQSRVVYYLMNIHITSR